MNLLLLMLAGIFISCVIGVVTSPRELQRGDRVSITRNISTDISSFREGHEFTINHVLLPYYRNDGCVNLISDDGRKVLFVQPNILKLINHD